MRSIRPAPRRYAVIQMDPVGMVKHFRDPYVIAAAHAIPTQKYLVYLLLPKGLPDPTEPWYEFSLDFVGTSLRAEDKKRGVTPDMVIPIYPNTSYPNAKRPPVRSHPTFPFPNCYHWVDTECTVRIRREPMWYDDDHAFKLDISQHRELRKTVNDDYGRIAEFLRTQATRPEVTSDDNVPSGSPNSTSDDYSPTDSPSYSHSSQHSVVVAGDAARALLSASPSRSADIQSLRSLRLGAVIDNREVDDVDDVDSLREGPWDPEGLAGSSSDLSLQSESVAESENSLLAIHNMDLFGLNVSSDTVELMPLVDMWLELTEHLTPETIGNPVDFFKEHNAIMR
ncbi:hypothetical protein C8Q77DRAFT_291327 [Trametes polyzona]|nr:hypothetical protein C8Q77DRAFT_291327 [Trametes polyzona]